jgi:hypothetical protein
MSNQGVYTFTLSRELKNYYRNYYGVKAPAEMAELTWIGANPTNSSQYSYNSLGDQGAYSYDSATQSYKFALPPGQTFAGGRIYPLVPWRWSELSQNQIDYLPPTWKTTHKTGWGVDYIDYILNPSYSASFTIASPLQNTGTTPAILSWPIPFGYVETNSGPGKTNNGDLSLINGNSLPLTIEAKTSDSTNKGPRKVTTGTKPSDQKVLWEALQSAGASTPLPNPPGLPNNKQNLTFDWAQVDPADTALQPGEVQQFQGSPYNNLKAYLQHLATTQDKAFLYHDLRAANNLVASVVASAYFYQDSNGHPYILVDGGSGNNSTKDYDTGLWLLPWNANQLTGSALSQFRSTANPNAGLESPASIYGNAGTAIFAKNKSLADLKNPGTISDVVAFFNNNAPSASYTGNMYYAGDLFLGLTYGLIGSSKTLQNTQNFPASPPGYPTDPGWGLLSPSTPVGQLPSAWWYANGSYTSSITGNFIGPIANRQIGPLLQPEGTDAVPFWNTYAVAIKNDKNLVLTNKTGEMEGTYGWPMDDRLGGNLVYFDNPGNSLNIEIGAPYTPAKQVVSIVSTTSTVNDKGDSSLVFEITRSETSGSLDVYYSIDTTEPNAAVLNKQYVIEGVSTPQMVKASFKSGEATIKINATPTPQVDKVVDTAFVKLKLDKDKSGNYSIDPSSTSATGSITSIAPTPLSTVSVLISGASQIPDSATQQLAYKISRSGDLSNTLSISLNLAGTAVSGVNYNDGSNLKPGNNTVVFEKGIPTVSYTITPIDTNQISPLTVILSIDPASTYKVSSGHASATGTILGTTTVFEQVGFQQVSDVPGLWTSSVASSDKGNLSLTAFVSEAKDGTPIAGQQISLVDATGNVIAGTQFISSERAKDSLTQAFGQKLYNAKSLAEFQSLAASSEQRSVGGDNLKPIIAPASDFSIKVAGQDSIQATNANSNGVYISSFQNSTAVSFSSGIFDLFGQTSPQNVQLQATSVGKNRNTLVAYRVDSITGAILQAGTWVKPGDAGYSQAALNNSLLKGDPLNLGFGESKVASFEEGTTKTADLFALALVTNGSISDYLANNPANQKGKGPNMFFSIGAANPDGAAHMISLDSGVVGFEDLWGGGDFDFNDVVVAFKNVPIVPVP